MFETKSFDSWVEKKFYDTTIFVPSGWHDILKSFYGDDYMVNKKRVNWGLGDPVVIQEKMPAKAVC